MYSCLYTFEFAIRPVNPCGVYWGNIPDQNIRDSNNERQRPSNMVNIGDYSKNKNLH